MLLDFNDGRQIEFLPGDSVIFEETGNAIFFVPKSGVEQVRTLLKKVMDDEQASNQGQEGAGARNPG